MWSSIESMLRQCASRRAWQAMLAAVALATVALAPTQSRAQVEYVKICSTYGANWFYLPGTDTCQNARQITANQFDIARSESRAATGIAMATSLVSPFLPGGTNYAVSVHWGGFDGKHAVGFGGLMRLSGNLVFSAGFATGLDYGSVTANERTRTEFGVESRTMSWSEVNVLGRAGFMYAW